MAHAAVVRSLLEDNAKVYVKACALIVLRSSMGCSRRDQTSSLLLLSRINDVVLRSSGTCSTLTTMHTTSSNHSTRFILLFMELLRAGNVPSDISTLPNGKMRLIPPQEQTAIAHFLRQLLECDVDKLPTDTLVHPFFHVRRVEMTSVADYESCLNEVGVTSNSVLACYSRLRGLCPPRFGSHGPPAEGRCHRMLHRPNDTADPSARRRMENFTDCMTRHRKRVDDRCLPLLKSICSSRTLRVTKVVRAPMVSMELLLRILPESKIIHLVRDPRAVALSRWNYNPSGRGHFSSATRDVKERLAREASIYCRRVVADARWRLLLEKQFPGRLLALTYEDLVNEPIKRAVEIYRFIGEADIQESMFQNFSRLAETGSRNMTAVELASSWRRELKPLELKLINERCQEMIEMYPQYANVSVARRNLPDFRVAKHANL